MSSDSEESHTNFALKYGLPFILLSDRDGKVREQYGATSIKGLPGRVTFVIDKKGAISHIFSSQLNVKRYVDEALNILKLIQ